MYPWARSGTYHSDAGTQDGQGAPLMVDKIHVIEQPHWE
jgi:hypothetical protein